MLTIHGMADSGNCYKPRLLMALLGRPFRHVEVSTLDGGTKQPAFLAANPNGKVPTLIDERDDGERLMMFQSGGILLYLADRHPEAALAPPPGSRGRRLCYQWLALLGADKIGVAMADEDQLHPEQSTAAIVVLHPQAKYFVV